MYNGKGFYDQIECKKHLKDDKLNTKYLDFVKKEEYEGYTRLHYKINHGCKDIKLFHCPEHNYIEAKINIGYFLKGHNVVVSVQDAKNLFEYLSLVTNTDMFKPDVKTFEYGSLFSIYFPYNKVQNSHIKIPTMKTSIFQHGKYFEDSTIQHRIYNGSKNIKNKIPKAERLELLSAIDYSDDKSYIKIENRYLKPEIALKSRGILIEDLFKETFINQCNIDLINRYQSIQKTNSMKITDKKQLSSEALYILALKSIEGIAGINAEELLKNTIKSFDAILSKEDKKNRMRQLKKNLEKIQTTSCPFDVSDLLRESLYSKN